jgi:hypothetical protein
MRSQTFRHGPDTQCEGCYLWTLTTSLYTFRHESGDTYRVCGKCFDRLLAEQSAQFVSKVNRTPLAEGDDELSRLASYYHP